MGFQDKKIAVLQQLRKEVEPISLPQLLEKLGNGYVERSVRRWLAEMGTEGLVEKTGSKRGTQYSAISQPIDSSKSAQTCFGPKSQKIIEFVRRPIYEREPVIYANDWFEAYIPNSTFYIPHDFRTKLYTAGTRLKQEDPAGTYAHQIFNRLLIDLSYNSSRLEGNTYSLLDTQRLVLEGASAEGKLDEEKIMILNHKEAIRYLVDTASKLQVNDQTICTLHYLLADGLVEPQYAGKVRDHGVRIGGSTYIPFEDPKKLQVQLKKITKKAAMIQDPYEQSLFLLIHISYLQSFTDVNKRTSRLSANIPLIKNNLVPLSFNDVEKEDYTSSMIAIYEMQDVQPLLDLYLFSYMRTCTMYDSTIHSLGFDEVRVRYRQQRRALLRHIIENKLTGVTMHEYISKESVELVKEQDRKAFIEDVIEDMREADLSRIAGLGITPDQLNTWKAL
ncbi:MAG: hypothetical protein JWO53_1030 [Chlamydiia bacterium]|nr:hypothetical protein [Chlamydiia bacterium]